MRIEHHNSAPSCLADIVNRRNEIGISRYDDIGICLVFMEVSHHGGREIHIRTFFLYPYHISIRATTFTWLKTKRHSGVLPLIVALCNLNTTNLLQRTQIYLLMLLCRRSFRIVIDP